jgi:phenylpropionate dioxygenase-like ring-hydroxylating dioxygenase large terminal subunit
MAMTLGVGRFGEFVDGGALARVRGEGGLNSRLPTSAYTDPGFLALEYQRWLARTWLYVGRGHELPAAGDVMPVPGHPFFLVRDKKGEVRAFQNACRHRGHALVDGPCRGLRLFTCPYHAWSYGLDGRLIGTPHFGGHKVHEVKGFDRADHGLVPVRCEMWHDWIFLNIDGEAGALADFVAPMAARLADVDFGKLTHYLTIDAGPLGLNWKLAMENNMEPYHVPVVHGKTAAGQPLSAHRAFVEPPVMGCTVDIAGSIYTNEAQEAGPEMLDMSSRFILRSPNFFLTTYAPDTVVDSLILPDSRDPRRCYLQNAWYTTSGRLPSEDEIRRWDELEREVLEEDLSVLRMVAKGLECAAVNDGGVLSPVWESCIASFYGELVEAMADT